MGSLQVGALDKFENGFRHDVAMAALRARPRTSILNLAALRQHHVTVRRDNLVFSISFGESAC